MKRGPIVAAAVMVLFLTTGSQAGPLRMSDAQMERITAGNSEVNDDSGTADGGVIAANSSRVELDRTANIDLGGDALSRAKALNIVTSAESTVGGAVNVWDGKADGGSPVETVTQTNAVSQTVATRVATVEGYHRDGYNVLKTFDSSSRSESDGTFSFTNDSSVDTRQIVNVPGSGQSIPGAGQNGGFNTELKAGQGIAGTASNLAIKVDAGFVDAGYSAGFNTNTQTEGALGAKLSHSTSANVEANLHWELPKVDLDFAGGICYVTAGICQATGTEDSTSHSVSESSESKSVRIYAPLTIQNARAEIVAVDDSEVISKTAASVALSGSALADVRAMNVVTAAGSVVANGLNAARTGGTGSGSIGTLTQSNMIVQSR